MTSLGTVNSTCFPKIHPSGAGEIEGDSRTLYQSSVVSCSSGFSSESMFLLLFAALPALGAVSLSLDSPPLNFGTRLHPMISRPEPLSRRVRLFSVLLRSGDSRGYDLRRSRQLPCACMAG